MKSKNIPQILRKGAWTKEEDNLLLRCIEKHGEGKWHQIPKKAGLNRCRKSCRLRWLNYLRPNIKRGDFDEDEVDLLLRLHKLLGNRWSLIAGRLPGRTGNDVKNYWNTHIQKKLHITTSQDQEADQMIEEKKENNDDDDDQERVGLESEVYKEQELEREKSSPQPYIVQNTIKPRPWTFSTNTTITREEPILNISRTNNNNNNNNNASGIQEEARTSMQPLEIEVNEYWWNRSECLEADQERDTTSSLRVSDDAILFKEDLNGQTWSEDFLQELLGDIDSGDSIINYNPPQLHTWLNDDSYSCKDIWDL